MFFIIVVLFVVGAGMFLAGVLARVGTGVADNFDSNAAASLSLLVIFLFYLTSFTSLSDITTLFETICGGIPFVGEIADYGSLRNVLHQAPLDAAEAFFDVVITTFIIDLLCLCPTARSFSDSRLKFRYFMVRILIGVMISLIALFALNYFKNSGVYTFLVSCLGAIISIISIGSIPLTITSLMKSNVAKGSAGIMAMIMFFSNSKILGLIRDAFLKSLVYVIGIYIVENMSDSIANSALQLSTLVVAFLPVLIMLIGIVYIVKSVL